MDSLSPGRGRVRADITLGSWVEESAARAHAGALAQEFLSRGDAVGWFEALYAGAKGDPRAVQWADLLPNPHYVAWAEHRELRGEGKRALVVGCGLGDDAEDLARRGFRVVAFDVSATAIAWCRRRFAARPSTTAWPTSLPLLPPGRVPSTSSWRSTPYRCSRHICARRPPRA